MWAALFHLIFLDMINLSHESFFPCVVSMIHFVMTTKSLAQHDMEQLTLDLALSWPELFKPTPQFNFFLLSIYFPLFAFKRNWSLLNILHLKLYFSAKFQRAQPNRVDTGNVLKKWTTRWDLEHCLIMKIPLHISRWSNKQTLSNWRHLLKCSLVVNWEDL